MAKHKETTDQKKELKAKLNPIIKVTVNDGMNTPVPDSTAAQAFSKSEAALYRQAENPLGDPHKI